MRTTVDAHRSLARYIALVLGNEWEVRLARDDQTFERPWAVVHPATPLTSTPVGARQGELRRTFAVIAFPRIGSTEEEARMEAERVIDTLERGFALGAHEPSMRRDRFRGHPMRVPLYDFNGLPLTVAATEASRDPRDFMRVDEPPSFGAVPDPVEDRAYVITGDIRMWWARSAGVPSNGSLVQSVGVEANP